MDTEWNSKVFRTKLAKEKIYDAWQFTDSLLETLNYMTISGTLLNDVYAYRIEAKKQKEREIHEELAKQGEYIGKQEDFDWVDMLIANTEINTAQFLQKTLLEFFHYARLSIDMIFQIINAALLGKKKCKETDPNLIGNVTNEIKAQAQFKDLAKLIDDNRENDMYGYIRGFDNHIKHIKTIKTAVKTPFLFGNTYEFTIDKFVYKDKSYPKCNVLDKVKEIYDYVQEVVVNFLQEIDRQIPNHLPMNTRIHDVIMEGRGKMVNGIPSCQRVAFFIEVEQAISELPAEIEILPLRITDEGKIYYSKMVLEKIFIRKKGTYNEILGCADLVKETENALYKTYQVAKCDIRDYDTYLEHPTFFQIDTSGFILGKYLF